ncbi:MAG: hypothetical protein JWO15_3844 [Sphingomonadales bacterium]|nr:hypothetical protein [Sphingomonadales bacterium]
MFAHGETVTRLRAPEVLDVYKAKVRDWDNATTTDILGWGIAQDATSEPLEVGRDSVRSDFTLYRDEPADIVSTDRLLIDGLTCEIVGRPAVWRHPMTGWSAGFVVKANVVEG